MEAAVKSNSGPTRIQRMIYHSQVRRAAPLLPAVLFLLAIFVYPISTILRLSFEGANGLTLQHYARIISVPLYLQVIRSTFQTAATVALLTLVLAYPVAYLLSTLSNRKAAFLLAVIAVPWFTSILVRSYAWMVLLGRAGLVNRALLSWGHPRATASALQCLWSVRGDGSHPSAVYGAVTIRGYERD